MDNLAFTTVVALLLAVPGYLARAAYFTGDFSKEVLPRSLTEEMYLSFLYSIPFHVVAVWIINECFARGTSSHYVDLELVLEFLSGRLGKEADGMVQLSDNLFQFYNPIVAYFGGMAATATVLGYVLRRAAWKFKWDIAIPAVFGYRNRWLYTFTGRESEYLTGEYHYVVLDVMCSLGGEKTRLYRGVVGGFDADSNGDLEQIRLALAYRGKFREPGGEFYWQNIPGEVLVLKYDSVQSLNVTRIPESKFNPDSPSFLTNETPAPQTPTPAETPSSSPETPAPGSAS